MSPELLENGWKRIGNGRRWRCVAPHWLCETDRENNVLTYLNLPASVNIIRKVRTFYSGKIFPQLADEHGNLADLLTANAMAESGGSVPTPYSGDPLNARIRSSGASSLALALAELVEYVRIQSPGLIRKEPKYSDPINTPAQISAGAHHMLISTALDMNGQLQLTGSLKEEAIRRHLVRVLSESVYAAGLALTYFRRTYSKHQLEPPLMAAIYNAGSLRPSEANEWKLSSTGNHIDRWITFYNTSRQLFMNQTNTSPGTAEPTLELTVTRKTFTETSTIGEMEIDGVFHCYTLEDKVREEGVKIFGETAIPYGRYEVRVTFSNHFQKEMPEILNVKGFAGVRIHGGNDAGDTLGCILVGKNKGPDHIWECKGVFDSLVGKIKSASPGKRCYLTIKK